MAMIVCTECKQEVSDKAEKCPNCGAPIAKKKSYIKGCGCAILIFLLLGMLGSAAKKGNEHNNNSGTSNVVSNTENIVKPINVTEQKTQKVNKIGETVSVGYWSYCITNKKWTTNCSDNEFLNKKPDYMYLKLDLIIRNDGKDSSNLPPLKLVDSNGNEFDTKHLLGDDKDLTLASVNPSLQKNGTVIFDVPQDRKYRVKLSGGYWSSDYTYVELD